MIGYDIIDVKNGRNHILNFEEAIKKVDVINFNHENIEFPGMIIFSREKNLIQSILNPSTEILKVEEEEFKNMLNLVIEKNKDLVFFDKKVLPKTTSRINLKLLKEKNVFIKEYDKTLIVDKVLFTTDDTEFQGIGLFTGREQVFLVSEKELEEIREYFKS